MFLVIFSQNCHFSGHRQKTNKEFRHLFPMSESFILFVCLPVSFAKIDDFVENSNILSHIFYEKTFFDGFLLHLLLQIHPTHAHTRVRKIKEYFCRQKSCFRTHSFILQLIYIKKLPILVIFFIKNAILLGEYLYLCNVFFIVLDLRLTKVGS